jgi:hypothetical protein
VCVCVFICVISGFRCEVYEICTILGFFRRRILVTPYRRFGKTNRFHLQGSRNSTITSWPLKMGRIGCPETLVRKYHYMLRNIPEKRSCEYVQFKNVPVNCVRYGICKSEIAQCLYRLKTLELRMTG